MQTLILGSTGDDVILLRQKLNRFGTTPILDINPNFDDELQKAVIAFQVRQGLPSHGIAADMTWAALNYGNTVLSPDPTQLYTGQPLPWIIWMRSHLGEPEVTGAIPTAFDREIFSHTSYGELVRMDAGCAATVCAALEETDYSSTRNALARSYATYGIKCELKPGAILFFIWANGGEHVTFCDHLVDETTVACIGGNQSSSLKISIYEKKYLAAIRWPVKA